MQVKTTVAAVLAACIANAAAQFSGLPTCAQSCATDAIPSSCGLDVVCICSSSSFIADVSCCIADACDAADQETTIEYADEICSGVGVTTLPTAAVCSSTAAGSAASATSTSAGTTASAASGTTTAASSTSTAASSGASSSSASGASATGSATSTTSSTSSSSASAATSTQTGAAPFVKIDGAAAVGAACLAAVYLA